MTYSQREGSDQGAQPVEIYTFIGSFGNYYFTSYDGGDQIIDFNTYRSIVIDRNNAQYGGSDQSEFSIDVSLPADEQIAKDYIFSVTPPKLTLTLERYHLGFPNDRVKLWTGNVVSMDVSERQATFKIPSIFSYILNTIVPTVNYQGPCNHFLYDERCKVNPANYSDEATVVSVNRRVIELSGSSFPANYCRSGDMITEHGEARMIMSHTSSTFSVNYPFANLKAGDTVTIRAGCDHSFQGTHGCIPKFNNGFNFGGFPTVPELNPFGRTL